MLHLRGCHVQLKALPPPDASDTKFAMAVNEDAVWTPPHPDHALWVTTLTARLLTSGAVHDPILRQLTEACKVKVSSFARCTHAEKEFKLLVSCKSVDGGRCLETPVSCIFAGVFL